MTTVPSTGPVRTPKHLYYFNGNGPWPGVTSITDVLDKPALVRWQREQVAIAALTHADRLVKDKEAGNVDAAVAFLLKTRNEGTAARDRGSRIHGVLESVLRRESVKIDPVDKPAVDGARLWLNEKKVKPLEVEAFLLNESLGYGGTCDFIAELEHEGKREIWLLDWKTSKSVAWPNGDVYEDMRLQLAAYGHAEFLAFIGDPQAYELPAIERYGIVHVTDGGTKLFPAKVTEDDWRTFRACLWIHNWRAPTSRSAA